MSPLQPLQLPITGPIPKAKPKGNDEAFLDLPPQVELFPEVRWMGSKKRLLPWIHHILHGLDFEAAADPFSGSGAVGYLMKAMGKRVVASDFLNVSATLAQALIENNGTRVDQAAMKTLLSKRTKAPDFIQRTFTGIFYTPEDLAFLDRVSGNIERLADPHQRTLAKAALVRSSVKKQPRGVFTVSGDLSKYDDGRRDLRLSMEEHFREQVEVFNAAVFSNRKKNKALQGDVFDINPRGIDLVYLDPPYVPRADDNCYVKRYHFIEGLSTYWQGVEIDYTTKVRKIPKKYTPFSYRREAVEAFDRMFEKFRKQIIVLSYSSNGYPDLNQLTEILDRHKKDVRVFARPHRYHFGTHSAVKRSEVEEYLIVGR
jgi:adenine-specific DNA-methyltransferase